MGKLLFVVLVFIVGVLLGAHMNEEAHQNKLPARSSSTAPAHMANYVLRVRWIHWWRH